VARHRLGLSSASRWRWPAAVAVVATGLSMLLLGNGLLHQDTWRGNAGDPEQAIWWLAYVPHAIMHGHNPLYTDFALYPNGANLMWNTAVILPALVMAPVTLTLGPVTTYNLLLVAAPATTAWAAQLALRRYVDHQASAAVGALLFAFTPSIVAHATGGHLQIALAALLPLLLLVGDEALIRQRWPVARCGVTLGLLAVAQLLTGEELLFIEALLGVIAVAILLGLNWRRRTEIRARVPYALRAFGLAGAVFVPLAAYPLVVQVFGRRHAPSPHAKNVYVADLANFVRPVDMLLRFGAHGSALPFTGNSSEWTSYLGIPLVITLVAVTMWCWRRSGAVRLAAIGAVVLAVCSLGESLHVNGHDTGIPMPWRVVTHIPVVSQLLPARLSIGVALCAAVLVAVFVDRVIAVQRPMMMAGASALVGAVVATAIPWGLPTTSIATPAFFRSAAVRHNVGQDEVVLVSPYIFGPASEQPMLWQAEAGMRYRMVDGWLIVPGQHWGEPTPAATILYDVEVRGDPVPADSADLNALTGYLHATHVTRVLVAPSYRQAAVMELFTLAFRHGPGAEAGGVAVWKVPA